MEVVNEQPEPMEAVVAEVTEDDEHAEWVDESQSRAENVGGTLKPFTKDLSDVLEFVDMVKEGVNLVGKDYEKCSEIIFYLGKVVA